MQFFASVSRKLVVAALLFAGLSTPAFAAYQAADISCETTVTTGTGTVNLAGALTGGYLPLVTTVTNGSTVPYQITTGSGASRKIETGLGVFTDGSPDTLTRVADWSTDGSGAELTLAGTSVVCVGPNARLFNSPMLYGNLNPNGFDISGTGDISLDTGNISISVPGAGQGYWVDYTNSGAVGPSLHLALISSTPAANDKLGSIVWWGNDSAANLAEMAWISGNVTDPTNGTEDTAIQLSVLQAGAAVDMLDVDSSGVYATLGPGGCCFEVSNTSSGSTGPTLYLYHNSSTPAVNDWLGDLTFYGNDSGGNLTPYAYTSATITDPTNTSESATLNFYVNHEGSALNALTLGGVYDNAYGTNAPGHVFDLGSIEYGTIAIKNAPVNEGGPLIDFVMNSATPADADVIGQVGFTGRDSGGTLAQYGYIVVSSDDVTAATLDSNMTFVVMSGGAAGGSNFPAMVLNAPSVGGLGYGGHELNLGALDTYVAVTGSATADGDAPGIAIVRTGNNDGAYIGYFDWYGKNSTGGTDAYVASGVYINDWTAGSEKGGMYISATDRTANNGATLYIDSGGIGISQGASKSWTLSAEDNSANGVSGYSQHYTTSPADNDSPYTFAFYGKDDADNNELYGYFKVIEDDVSNGTEDAEMRWVIKSAGSDLTALTLAPTYSMTSNFGGDAGAPVLFNFGNDTGGNYPAVQIDLTTADNSSAAGFAVHADSATPAANDFIGWFGIHGEDSAGNYTTYTEMRGYITDPTNGSEDSRLSLVVMAGGSQYEALSLGDDVSALSGNHSISVGSTDFGSFTLYNTSAATGGPGFVQFQDSASPAAADRVGWHDFFGRDSAANTQKYAGLAVDIVDTTSTSEDGKMVFYVTSAGSDLTALTLGGTDAFSGYSHIFDFGSVDAPDLMLQNSSAGVSGPRVFMWQNSASPAVSDTPGDILVFGRDSAANGQQYSNITTVISSATSGSESSQLRLGAVTSGTSINFLTLGTNTTASGNFGHVFNFGSAASARLALEDTSAGSDAAHIEFFANSASPAASDNVGELTWYGKDSAANSQFYASHFVNIIDATNASEDSTQAFQIDNGGAALQILTLGGSDLFGVFGAQFDLGSGNDLNFTVKNTSAGANGVSLVLAQDSASPAASDIPASVYFTGRDSAANAQIYGSIITTINDATSTSEDAATTFNIAVGGSTPTAMKLGNTGLFRWYEATSNGSNFKGMTPSAAITSDTTCTFEDDANFIPDSCVGNGTDDTSDERLKENFSPAGDVGAMLDGIQIYDYQWNRDLPDLAEAIRKGAHGFGPKAQELYKVNPYLVRPGGDDPEKEPWTWLPERVVPYLIVEVQSLRKRVKALEERPARCFGLNIPHVGCLGLSY